MRSLLENVFCAIVGIMCSLHPDATGAQSIKQILLTETQLLSSIAVRDELMTTQLTDALAKKHGFSSLAEYNDVAANVRLISDRIEPHSKDFIEVQIVIANQIEAVLSDRAIDQAEKEAMLKHLHGELGKVTPVRFRGNIDIVLRHYRDIERCCDNDISQMAFAEGRGR